MKPILHISVLIKCRSFVIITKKERRTITKVEELQQPYYLQRKGKNFARHARKLSSNWKCDFFYISFYRSCDHHLRHRETEAKQRRKYRYSIGSQIRKLREKNLCVQMPSASKIELYTG